eukprot:CAMPEP_0181332160 /NCGR_PEP_ID=MMETSP1101-20121128/24927_1 /TAXON_ID=46948 /ORGANISM="Rhodomonas abbreviata, Strain Caron Lab Isolate" /LENGTH=77 /DNA_ID=CAMNT_0023441749 /DNA_START=580 /DNA_END=813 /DNA_ORIENTATION=-
MQRTYSSLAVVVADARGGLSVRGVPHVASGGVVRHVEVGAKGLEAVTLEEGHVRVEVVQLGSTGNDEEGGAKDGEAA